MKKVTIQDIADALGISRNTVSKAINNSEGLADSTREKILQKAVEMGYKQFSYVASLSGSGIPRPASAGPLEPPAAFGEIALFTTNLSMQSNHFAVPMLDRFKQELALLGYTPPPLTSIKPAPSCALRCSTGPTARWSAAWDCPCCSWTAPTSGPATPSLPTSSTWTAPPASPNWSTRCCGRENEGSASSATMSTASPSSSVIPPSAPP